ncbi:DUF11 domain-containing protein [Aquihabitans daechungensis]|uniref:DUF11 domain-containing protein n=1 Tax=Aquihabitans daechungensis TaxID=1052257 RepID=UPI003BA12AE8
MARGSHSWRRWAVALTVVGVAGSGALAPITAGAVDPSADLSATVSHAPDTVTAPADITFTITASNAGPDTAEDVAAGLGFQYPLDLRTVPTGCRRSSNYDSVVCELGDIPSGGTASVAVVLQARGSGIFTIPAVVASETPDPDTADRVATDSLLVKAGPSQAVRYIRGIFPSIMGRNPDTATTNYWAGKWKAENNRYPRNLARVPAGIIQSNEYRRIRVREAFQRIFARAPEASALTYWVNQLAKGMSYETLDRRLMTSIEGSRGVESVMQLIRDSYQAVLGRQPTTAEENAAFASQSRQSYGAFVLSLQHSTEAYDVVIKRYYQATVGHDPNALGRYVWQLRLRQGVSPEALWAELFVTNEVLQKYPYTVDDYEGSEYDAVPASRVEAALAAG